MTMIEKVARALAARCGVDPDDMNGGTWDGGSYSRGKPAWTAWSDDARTAIEAMREPTDKMHLAGYTETGIENPTGVYQAMLDAALSETP